MKALFPSDDPCVRGCLVLGVITGCIVFMLNWIGSGFDAGIVLGPIAGFMMWGALRFFVCTGRHIQPGAAELDHPLRRAAGWGDHVHNIFSHEPQGETRAKALAAAQTPAAEAISKPAPVASPAPVPKPAAVAEPVKLAAEVVTPSDLAEPRAMDGEGKEIAPAKSEKAVAAAKEKPTTKPLAKPAAEKAPADKPASKSKAPAKAAPKSGKAKPDDLKKIKGIGPVYEKALHKLGYTTFEQVAGWTKADIDRMQEEMPGFDSRIESEDWIGQAAELAKGKGV